MLLELVSESLFTGFILKWSAAFRGVYLGVLLLMFRVGVNFLAGVVLSGFVGGVVSLCSLPCLDSRSLPKHNPQY